MGKYIVNLRAPFTSNWSKSKHESLAGALNGAWRKHHKDFSVDNVSYEQKVVINSESLAQAISEMDNLAREQPKRPSVELAELVIQKMNNAITQDEMWERMNFIKAANAGGGAAALICEREKGRLSTRHRRCRPCPRSSRRAPSEPPGALPPWDESAQRVRVRVRQSSGQGAAGEGAADYETFRPTRRASGKRAAGR